MRRIKPAPDGQSIFDIDGNPMPEGQPVIQVFRKTSVPSSGWLSKTVTFRSATD